MKVVAVGFKVEQENSVYYKKVKVEDPLPLEFTDKQTLIDAQVAIDLQLGKLLRQAREEGAEFVSVRFIKEGTP